MEHCSYYEDYQQTTAFLRAARNRLLNGCISSVLEEATRQEYIRIIHKLHNEHLECGAACVDMLYRAIENNNASEIKTALKQLASHNRMTARLSRLFERDLGDVHPDPDAPVPDVPKPLDPTKSVGGKKLLPLLKAVEKDKKKLRDIIKPK